MLRTLIFWTLLSLWAPTALTQTTNDLSTLGLALTGSPLALDGDQAMETVGLNNVIRDHADPSRPTLVGWLPQDQAGLYGHRVHDDGLVVALHVSVPWGFDLIDVQDPTTPTRVFASTGMTLASAWLDDEILVVASDNFGVIYRLDDPSAPQIVSAVTMGDHQGRRWFASVDGVLYGIDRGARLRAIDLGSPTPEDLGTITLDTTRIEALVAGDGVLYVVVTGAERRLLTLVPTSAVQLAVTSDLLLTTDTGADAVQMARRDHTLLVAPGDGTVRILDLAHPQQPEPTSTLAHGGENLAITEHQILSLADETLRITDRATLETLAMRPVIPMFRTVMGEGAVVLAQRNDQPQVVVPVDISNPEVPQPGDAFDLGFGAYLHLEGDLLVVSDGGNRFDVWDAGDPNALVKLSTVRDPDIRFGRAMIDDHRVAFFDHENGGISLYDLSDPVHPLRATGILTAYPRAYLDGLMLSGSGSPLRLFTAHDPHHPKLASRVFLNGNPLAATLAPGLLLASVERLPGEVTLHLLETTDPGNPVELCTLPLPGRVTSLTVHGSRVYAQSYHTTWVIDISDPLAPEIDGEFATWGQAGLGLAFHGDLTLNSGWLVSLHDAGYVITGTPAPVRPVLALQPAYPNPFNPSTTLSFDVPRAGRYQLTIHDARGRRVAKLVDSHLTAGPHQHTWTGRNSHGLPIASGIYLVRLSGAGLESHQTITLVK